MIRAALHASWKSMVFQTKMYCVSDHTFALQGFTDQRTPWANEMNFGLNHTPGQDCSPDLLACSSQRHHCTSTQAAK